MKKIIYILALLPLWGCSGFLDEVDQDKLIPEKVEHYEALLLKEFNGTYPLMRTVDHMTDNLVEDPTATTSRKFSVKTTYTWQREIEIDENGNRISGINSSWEFMYEDIAIANYVIELIDDALGEENQRNYTKGEAYFIRALSYFNLVNLYGLPYNEATANVDLGVPLRDNIGVELTYSRNTVAECYAFIENDLEKAIELITLSAAEKSIWHPNLAACNLLRSRIKLYQQKWDEAIDFADKVIESRSLVENTPNAPFVTQSNSEILYSYYTTNPIRLTDDIPFKANPQLINMYEAKDLRKAVFFSSIDDGTGRFNYYSNKYIRDTYTELGFANFRVAEAYLNRAEAYAKKGESANALNDIMALHAKRYSDVSGIVYPSNPTEVLTLVLNERRKEFCFEDHHRWFDLRRMENRPEIQHEFTLIENNGTRLGKEVYTLLSNDLNYTLPIPIQERNNNPLIRNNERYEKIPIIVD